MKTNCRKDAEKIEKEFEEFLYLKNNFEMEIFKHFYDLAKNRIDIDYFKVIFYSI